MHLLKTLIYSSYFINFNKNFKKNNKILKNIYKRLIVLFLLKYILYIIFHIYHLLDNMKLLPNTLLFEYKEYEYEKNQTSI